MSDETVEVCDASFIPGDGFKPTRAVVISELSKDLKEQYYNLILTNNVKLQYTDEKFVANIRMIGPSTEEDNGSDERKEITPEGTERSVNAPPTTAPKKCNSSLPLEQRIHRLQYASASKSLTFQIAGVAHFDYSAFPRFCSLIGDDNDVVRPQLRSVSWLMRVVEDIYDSRFAHEKSHIIRKERQKSNRDRLSGNVEAIEGEGEDSFCNSFPVFVAQRLTTVIGLKALTDQTCWDLLCNIDRNYKDFLEIETFKFFLQEKFGDEDLLFFLYLRSIISKILKVNFSGRWTLVHGPERQPKPIYLTYQECALISNKVYGTSYAEMGKDFLLSLVTSQKLTGRVNKREDTRKIEVRDLLYLAVVGYHKTQSVFDQGPEDEVAAAEALSKYKAGRVQILANARSIDQEQRRNDRLDGAPTSATGEKLPVGKANELDLSQQLKNKTMRTRSSLITTVKPQLSPKKGLDESEGSGPSASTGTGAGAGNGTETVASARRASLARVSTGTMTSIAKERPKVRAKIQPGSAVKEKEKEKERGKGKNKDKKESTPTSSPVKEVVLPTTPPTPASTTTTASQTAPIRLMTTSEKLKESRRPKETDLEREAREAEELQEKANARAIIHKINESLKKKPPSKVPIPSEQNERRTSWEQYNEAIGASERSHTPPRNHLSSASVSTSSPSLKSSKPFSSHSPPPISMPRAAGGYLETNPGVSSSSSSSSGRSFSCDHDELEMKRLRDRQRVTVQPRISSQSLLRNRESSVSAFRRERRKSEIGTASTMERRPVPLASKPVQKLSLSASGKRSPTSSRSFIPERRFSTGSGGADRPSRRSSDTSVLSIDTSTEMKKRLSMRIPTGTSPAPFNLSPSKMAAKEYSFSEIYDSTTKLDADADLDKNNTSMRSYEDKNVNPYSGLNSPLKRLRPPPLVNPAIFVTPPSRSPSPCFTPRDSQTAFFVPQTSPLVTQPMPSPPAAPITPKASQQPQSRPSTSSNSKSLSVKTSPSHTPKFGSPTTPKASQHTPKASSDPFSYANSKPYPPPPAPVTPKGHYARAPQQGTVTPKSGPSTATSAQRKRSIPSSSSASASKSGTLRTVPSPAILKTAPPPPPPVLTSGLTVSGLRRLSFRLLNQGDGHVPDTVLGALSSGKPRTPKSFTGLASPSMMGPEQIEEASFARYFSNDGVLEEKRSFTESRTASPRTGAATMPPSGVVMREVMAISQRNTPKSSDSAHTPRMSGTPKRFSFVTSNLFGPESEESERSDPFQHTGTGPNPAVSAALAMSPRAGDVDNGGEDDDERLATLRTQLEKEILESSCGALKGSGFTPNIAEVIMDEITLLIHLKINDLFGEEEIQEIDSKTVNKRIVGFLVAEREPLTRLLEEKVVSMVDFVKANIQ